MAITKDQGRQWPLIADVAFTAGAGGDVEAIGTYEAIDLPIGAVVTGGELYLSGDPGGTSATVAVQIGANVLIAATDYSAADREAVSITGAGGIATATPLTVADTVDIVVATADLDAGTPVNCRLVIQYYMDDRATETLD